jgi:hypothetical protein
MHARQHANGQRYGRESHQRQEPSEIPMTFVKLLDGLQHNASE